MQSGCVKRARSAAEESLDERMDAEYEAGGPGLQIEGVRGHGPPVFCNANGKRKPFTDGFCLLFTGSVATTALRQDHFDNANLSFHHNLGQALLKLPSSCWMFEALHLH